MIHVYHGEQTAASRAELTLLKDKYAGSEIITFDGRTVTITELIQATQSQSLFGSDRLIIVENLFSRRLLKKTEEAKEFASFMSGIAPDVTIVFWEEKELGKRALDLFPTKTDRALFRPDRVLFQFVESIRPGYNRQMLALFTRSLDKDVPELIFSLLTRQIRFMLMAKENVAPPDLAPWQMRKFASQAINFTLPELTTLYKRLFEIDVTIKSGNTPFSLTEELKLFLAKI